MRRFYEPTAEHLERLSAPWCASYSGGKDSTALVTWVEWLRRAGWVTAERPQLVQSDTTVEYPDLEAMSADLRALLERSGWTCTVVKPAIHEKLYNRILGIGNSPIHPGGRKMRWCTRSTKVDPMRRERKAMGDLWTLTGLRLGESAIRDEKLRKRGCAAGGECGIPDPDERTYSPLLDWRTCHVWDWLTGKVGGDVRALLRDVYPVTNRLVEVYGVEWADTLFDYEEAVSTARFGCVGCPAIGSEREPPRSVVRRHGARHPLNELYDVWYEARLPENRLVNARPDRRPRKFNRMPGPIRLEARKRLFARVMDIQRRAGVVLITPEDEAFIRDCWARRVYPRGWSEADEATAAPAGPLFEEG